MPASGINNKENVSNNERYTAIAHTMMGGKIEKKRSGQSWKRNKKREVASMRKSNSKREVDRVGKINRKREVARV